MYLFQMHYLFQHLFHVSKALIHLRVGYEALWYDRRNLLKLFLNCLSSTSEKNIAITSSGGGGGSSSTGGGSGGGSNSGGSRISR